VLQSVLEAWKLSLHHRGSMLKITMPLVGITFAYFAANAVAHHAQRRLADPVVLFWAFATLYSTITAAVSWHRLLLLGEPIKAIRKWHSADTAYLKGSLLIALIATAVFIPIVLIMALIAPAPTKTPWGAQPAAPVKTMLALGLATMLTVAIISARTMVLLPGRAIGNKMRATEAFNYTRGNTFRIVLAMGAAIAPLIALTQLIQLGAAYAFLFGMIAEAYQLPAVILLILVIMTIQVIYSFVALTMASVLYGKLKPVTAPVA